MAEKKHVIEYTDIIKSFEKVKEKLKNKSDKGHQHGNADITDIDASKIKSGTIDIDRLPKGAIERMVYVKDDAARFALTTNTVQNGDTVKVTSTKKMFYVIDDTKLSSEAGYEPYTAESASAVPWSGVTGKPTTFTPEAHTHAISEVADLQETLTGLRQDVNAKPSKDTNTTYSLIQDSTDGHKLTFKGSDGSTKTVTIPDNDHNDNTTYSLKKTGSKIQLVGSDGSTTEVTDDNTTYDLDAMINALPVGTDDPVDNDYYVSQNVDGGTSNTGYFRRPVSKLWNYIKTKLATVATSGSYTDLSNKPTIGNGKITVNQNGTTKGTFTMNQTGDTIINLTDSDTNTNTWRDVVDGLDSTRTDASLSANQGRVLNDKIDAIQIGGRNLILHSDKWTSSGSGASGITPSRENDMLKIVVASGNSNWHRFYADNVIEANLNDGDPFTFSIEIKSADGTVPPDIYFKSGMGYFKMTGSVSSEFSWVYYTGTWKKANDIVFHFGWSARVGTYYIRKIKLEKGNKATDWSPAPEDVEADATTKANNALSSAKYYTDTQVSPINTSVSKLQSQLGSHTVNSDVPANAKFTDTDTWRGIQDNLTSTSTSDSLSANQGRILKSLVDGKANNPYSHIKSISSSSSGTWYVKATLDIAWSSELYSMEIVADYNNTNGKVYIEKDSYDDKWKAYVTDYNFSHVKGIAFQGSGKLYLYIKLEGSSTGSASCTLYAPVNIKSMEVLSEADVTGVGFYSLEHLGQISNTSVTTYSGFYGNLHGTADIAASVKDYGNTAKQIQIGFQGRGISGDAIKYIAGYTDGDGGDLSAKIKDISKDALKAWLGLGSRAYDSTNYLPSNGGDLNGTLHVKPTTGSYTEGMRIYPYDKWSTIMLNGTDNTGTSGTSPKSWGLFNNDGQFYITKNGANTSPTAIFSNTDGTWRANGHELITAGNIGSQNVNYANSAGSANSVAWGNVSGRPSSLPASDVYAWAKASSKPSYSWSEIGGRPTTLSSFTNDSGYITGITKAMVTGALGYTPPTTDTNTTYSASTGLNLSGTSFSVKYGSTAGTACQGNDSRLSNSRPASDVYSWAKASSKPSYTWTEISNKPDIPSISKYTPTRTNWTINSEYNCVVYRIGDFCLAVVAVTGTIYPRQWLPAAQLSKDFTPKIQSSIVVCSVSGSDHMECMVTKDGYIKMWWSGSSPATSANICVPYYMG